MWRFGYHILVFRPPHIDGKYPERDFLKRNEMLATVILKNGAEESEILVRSTVLSLRGLMLSNPIAFLELVSVCRNREHTPFGNTPEILKSLAMMQSDGSIHGSIRNIVLSAAEGEDLELHLVSPIKD